MSFSRALPLKDRLRRHPENWAWTALLVMTLAVARPIPAAETDSPTQESPPNSTLTSDIPAITTAGTNQPSAPALEASSPSTNGTDSVQTTNATTPFPPVVPLVSSEEVYKTYLQLQGQLDTTRLAIEQNRRERELVEETNQRRLEERLQSMEKSIDDQRNRELEAMRESNENMLKLAGIIAGAGILVMLLTSIFHFRAMTKFSRVVADLPRQLEYLAAAEDPRLLPDMDGQPRRNAGLLRAIDRLEKRVHELEHWSPEAGSNPAADAAPMNGPIPSSINAVSATLDQTPPAAAAGDNSAQVQMILGKGQALLQLGQAQQAVACFDKALSLDPKLADAWIKKGTALEKLQRLEAALDCYDHALASDPSLTLAHLYKGGVLNRMERYNEALVCYEKALQSQKPVASTALANQET